MKWRLRALADLQRHHLFVHDKNPKAAAQVMQSLFEGAEILSKHPNAGRPMPDETGRHEWFIPFGAGAYVLRYRLDKKVPVILRVWHCKENRN